MKNVLWISFLFAVLVTGCKKKDQVKSDAVLTTVAVTNITANSAQSGGTITNDGGSSISNKGVCWAVHSGATISDSVLSAGAGNAAFTSAMANLNANTIYYVKAFAINGLGTAYGNEISFTSAKGAPSVTTTAISNNAALQAQTGGNVTNDGGAPVTARGVCWSTSPHPTTTDSKTSDSTGTGSFADTLTNLNLATYYVRAYATNSYGTAYGNEISFTVNSTGTVTDIDGNAYTTVVIGTQTWMGSNLKTSHYQNGDPITNGLTNFDWLTHTEAGPTNFIGAYTFPDADSTNNAAWGKLYNNVAVNDSRGICPAGWHVPSDGDWQTLEFYEGMSASDTSVYGGGGNPNNPRGGAISQKFLEGGSSGLNIQLAGEMVILGPGNYKYANFAKIGFYWAWPGLDFGDPFLYNFFRGFNDPAPAIYRAQDGQQAFSVRCVKN